MLGRPTLRSSQTAVKTINPNIRAPLLIVLILFLGASFSVSSQVPKAESRTSDTRITTGASLPDLVPVGPVSEPRADASLDSANYVIRLGDSLELKVYDEDDVNTETRVDQEGGITVPLLGRVVVQGLTTEAARQLITTRLHAEYILNPRVTLTVKEFAPRRFSVMGEVSRPGFFEIPARQKINLLQAIAMAMTTRWHMPPESWCG